jgi:hypothetical protein
MVNNLLKAVRARGRDGAPDLEEAWVQIDSMSGQ